MCAYKLGNDIAHPRQGRTPVLCLAQAPSFQNSPLDPLRSLLSAEAQHCMSAHEHQLEGLHEYSGTKLQCSTTPVI